MRKIIEKNNYKKGLYIGAGVALAVLFCVVSVAKAFDFWGDAAKQAGNRAYEDNKSALTLPAAIPSLGTASSDGYCSGDEAQIQIGCNAKVQNLTIDDYGYFAIGSLKRYYIEGTLADATTTLIALDITATGTIDLLRLDVTGPATSTYTVTCGTSSSAYGTPSATLISSASIVTSSLAILENAVNYPSGQIATSTSAGYVAAGTFGKLGVESDEYLLCKVTTAYDGAFTEVTNTFAGTYLLTYTVKE